MRKINTKSLPFNPKIEKLVLEVSRDFFKKKEYQFLLNYIFSCKNIISPKIYDKVWVETVFAFCKKT